MPQHKKRELESYLREFATHVQLDNCTQNSKSGTSGSSSEGVIDQSPQSTFSGALQYNVYTTVPPVKEVRHSQIQPQIQTAAWTPSQAQICEVSTVVEAIMTKPTLLQRDVICSNSIDGWLPLYSLYDASNDLNDMNIPISYLRHCLRRGTHHLELSKDQRRARLKRVIMTGDSSKDTGSDSTGSSFSNNNVYGSTFWALRTDVPQMQDKAHYLAPHQSGPALSMDEDSSSFRPYTPCFSSGNVVSSISPKRESDPNKRRTNSSNWSSDDPLTADMTISEDMLDERYERDREQCQTQQSHASFNNNNRNNNSISNNNRQSTQKYPADAAKAAPIIYIEGETFCLDLSRFQKSHEMGPEEDDIPEYVRDGEVVLGVDWDDSSKWQDLFCWNCESKLHTLRDCSHKFDDTLLCKNALEYARRYPDHQCNFRRYFDETALRQRVEDMIVGKPSDALKEALGVSKDDLIMPYYDNMVKHGYPPGWKRVIRRDIHKQGNNIHRNLSNTQEKLKGWDSGRLVQISAYDTDSVQSVPSADIAKTGGDDGSVKFWDGTSKPVVDGKIGSHYHSAVGTEQRAKHSNDPRIKLVDYPGLSWHDEEFKPNNESETCRTDSGLGSSNGGSEVSFDESKKRNLPKAGKIVDVASAKAEDEAIDVR